MTALLPDNNFDLILSLSYQEKPNWPYKKNAEYHVPFGKKTKVIRRYELCDIKSSTLTAAIKAITQLLETNKELISIFDVTKVPLAIESKNTLTINGRAICLSDKLKINPKNYNFLDHHFSADLIERPYKCQRNHLMNISSLEFWVKKEKTCPCDEHQIETTRPLSVDENEMRKIKQQKTLLEQESQKLNKAKSQLGQSLEIHQNLEIIGNYLQQIDKGIEPSIKIKNEMILLKNPETYSLKDILTHLMLPCFVGIGILKHQDLQLLKEHPPVDMISLMNYGALALHGGNIISEIGTIVNHLNSNSIDVLPILKTSISFIKEISIFALPLIPSEAEKLRAIIIIVGTACIATNIIKNKDITESDITDLIGLRQYLHVNLDLFYVDLCCGLVYGGLKLKGILVKDTVLRRIILGITNKVFNLSSNDDDAKSLSIGQNN